MISANLSGGLGNQMFQIMAAYAHSKDVNDDLYFDFDKCYTPNQGFKSTKYADFLFKNLKNDRKENYFQFIYNEPTFGYRPIPKEKNLILNGCFQSEKYFTDYTEDVFHVFNIDSDKVSRTRTEIELKTNSSNITSVHVRRGDYLQKPLFHPTVSLNYLKKSMGIVSETKYIFISDDIEWCKNNFYGDNIFYSDYTNEIDDLYLIMSSDNKILSNSSFSWWGDYLSKYKGITIAPKIWFGPQGPQDTEDIYNKNWTII